MPWCRLRTRATEPEEGTYRPNRGNESIGDKGAFNAGVYIVKRRSDSRKCIEKRFRPKEIWSGDAKFEICLVRELSHKHITEYIDSFIDISGENPRASLYMEYCDLGTLADALQRRRTEKKPVKEWGVWELFVQLTNAVAYCHYGIHDAVYEPNGKIETPWHEIMHRDIKPANIFLRTDSPSNPPQVVLGDFGQAIRRDQIFRQYQGDDLDWAPPEAPDFKFSSDTWSIGVVVQAMCRLETSPPTIGPRRTFWGAGKGYSPNLNHAIQILMRNSPQERPGLGNFARNLNRMRHEVPNGMGVNSQ